jgi:hypothetical protein
MFPKQHRSRQRLQLAAMALTLVGCASVIHAEGCSPDKTPVTFESLFQIRADQQEIYIVWDEQTQCLVVAPQPGDAPWVLDGRNLVFDGGEMWVARPTTIRSFPDTAQATAPATTPAQPATPGNLGAAGTEGTQGDPGLNGRDASNVLFNVIAISGAHLSLIINGERGATGGNGGRGGAGTMGAKGVGQACKGCSCRNNSTGGSGGTGGRAGKGGAGGSGGAGGTCRFSTPVEQALRSGVLKIDNDGGAAGDGGLPGLPGPGGAQGPGGDGNNCCGKRCSGGGAGSAGTEGGNNDKGARGKAGVEGKLIVLTPEDPRPPDKRP